MLDACFSKGGKSFEIIHQNTGCQNNVVRPLTSLIFKRWKELKIRNIWQVLLGSVEFNIAPDTLFSMTW